MGLTQTAFDFGSPRAQVRLDAETEALRSATLLERRLTTQFGREVALCLTDNGRTMVSARERHGVLQVRLHHMFGAADDVTLRAVVRYLREGCSVAVAHLRQFVDQNRALIRRREAVVSVRGEGHHHDLRAIYEALNARYFDGRVSARITWGRMGRPVGRRRRRRSIKLGSYRQRDALIRVHPLLDADWVPDYFVQYIVYHEMVHQVVDGGNGEGRRTLHGREFKARERLFERYDDALAWEHAHLDRLLSG